MFVTPAGIGSVSATQNTGTPWLGGNAGEGIVADLHLPMYTAAYRGRCFFAATATAGTTIPVQAGSLAATFMIWNPLGSGVNLELLTYTAAFEAATQVVSDVSLYFQAGVGSSTVAPTTLGTAITIQNGLLGGGTSPQTKAYAVATLVGAITKGPILFGPTAVNSTAGNASPALPIRYDFRGEIVVPPGTLVTTAGNAAQSQATEQCLFWAEWPI
jgi:hypothetical protein